MPTRWYGEQHTFEYEFVVTQPLGYHKVFSHLKFISNKAKPSELKITITGEAYDFHKQKYPKYGTQSPVTPPTEQTGNPEDLKNITNWPPVTEDSTEGYINFESDLNGITFDSNVELFYDTHTKEQQMVVGQDVIDMEDEGRRLGNAFYKEDAWDVQLTPIQYTENGRDKETLIRDKYAKIRVVYTGEDLAIISAIKTVFTMSFA